jgi:hypothetical protein
MNLTNPSKPNLRPSSASVATNLTVVSPTFPPAPIVDSGRICLGAQSPVFGVSQDQAGPCVLSPDLSPELIADKGLVRLGAQSPVF